MPQSDPPDSRSSRVLPRFSNAELVRRLHAEACQGPLWLTTSAVLADTCLSSVLGMIRAGSINCKLAGLLRKAQPGRYFHVYPDERQCSVGWAGEAAARGLDKFRRDIIAGRGWDARGCPGQEYADLRTWVLNTILLQIPDVLDQERTRAARHARDIPYSPDLLRELSVGHGSEFDDLVDVVISEEDQRRLEAIKDTMPEELKAVIDMQVVTGLSRAECCRRLGIPERSIEGKIRRWRRTHRGQEK